MGQQRTDLLAIEFFDPVGAERPAGVTGEPALNAQQIGGSLPHHLTTLAEEIPHRSIRAGINIAFGEYVQPQQVGQPARIAMIVGILESFILVDRRRIDEMNRITLLHESIDQPVPVIG
ncbi:MAG TPA: hypothetical protein VN039_13870 [Nitrospira sp.]|nr:hypothetical protein [Nitrospira sp.]